MVLAATVHTSGVNVASLVAIVSSIVVVMSVIIGVFAKIIGGQITSAIDRFRNEVVSQLDHRLTIVEVKIDNIRGTQTGNG